MQYICDHVTEKCFEPSETHKDPCPCAIAHKKRPECIGSRCERWMKIVQDKATNLVFTKHTEIE